MSASASAVGSEVAELEEVVELQPASGGQAFDKLTSGTEGMDVDDPEADGDCMDCGRREQIKDCQKFTATKGKKKFFKCNACNALKARMARLSKHKNSLAEDFGKLTQEAKQEFMAKSKDLKAEALQEGMEACIAMYRELIDSTSVSSSGAFKPLSVWANMGYSAEHCKSMETKANKKWDATLNDWTYQLFIDETGTRAEEVVKNKLSYKTGTRRKAESSDEEVDKPKRQKPVDAAAAKKEDMAKKKELEKQVKKDKATADRLIKLIEPVLTTATALVRYKIRLPTLAAKIPEFVKDECTQHLEKLEMIDAVWKEVKAGKASAPTDEKYQPDAVADLKKKATKSIDGLASIVKMAENAE